MKRIINHEIKLAIMEAEHRGWVRGFREAGKIWREEIGREVSIGNRGRGKVGKGKNAKDASKKRTGTSL